MKINTGLLSLLFGLVLMVPPLLAMPATININSADVEILTTQLTGIGPAKAAAIVEYREKNGPFAAVEDLVLVKGIGWKTMEANRENIRLRDDDAMHTGMMKGNSAAEKSATGKSSGGGKSAAGMK